MKSIVVSVCAVTAEELFRQIKQAEELGDIIEVRFDCLDEDEFESALIGIDKEIWQKPFLATSRPASEMAHFVFAREIFEDEKQREDVSIARARRRENWEKILSLKNVKYVDLELDIHHLLWMNHYSSKVHGGDVPEPNQRLTDKLKEKYVIVSEHFFGRVPEELDITRPYADFHALMGIIVEHSVEKTELPDIPEQLKISLIKIAADAEDTGDSLKPWRLNKPYKELEIGYVPIAMGEAGKWTRILGLAYGAPMTYAALESGKEVAPGQISAEDLRDVYRVKELDEVTEIFGIIGDPVKFSLSPYMQNAALKSVGRNAVFVPFEVKDLDIFIREFVPESGLNFRGLSVTLPHKQAVMNYLDEIDDSARKIGAVNTLKFVDGKLHGFNTDAPGFIAPLKQKIGDLAGKKAAILGAGGAARACIHALQKEGVEVTIFARNVEKAEIVAKEFDIGVKLLSNQPFNDFDIVINATPLGMNGKFEGETPSTFSQLEGVPVIYDLIYSPEVTPFMREAAKAGVPTVIGGLEMLVAQGAEQFRIWTGTEAPVKEMEAAIRKRLLR